MIHRHKWGRWETGTEKCFNLLGEVYKVKYWQKRECETCGKLQMRKVATLD